MFYESNREKRRKEQGHSACPVRYQGRHQVAICSWDNHRSYEEVHHAQWQAQVPPKASTDFQGAD